MANAAPDAERIARLRDMYADEVNGGALFRGLAEYAAVPPHPFVVLSAMQTILRC